MSLIETAPPPGGQEDWSEFVENVYSQNGEDGILAEVFRRIGTTNRWCFEVGAADGTWFSNTRRLVDAGWNAVLVEADAEKYAKLGQLAHTPGGAHGNHVIAVNEAITPTGAHSLDAILERQGVFPRQPDLGIIDIDGDDYYVFLNLLWHRPRVLVVEFDPNEDKSFVPERGSGRQAGLDAILSVAAARSYGVVLVVGPNVVLVAREEFHKITGEAVAQVESEIAYPPTDGDYLDIGCGNAPRPGHIGIDRKTGGEAFPLKYDGTPIEDNSIAGVVASHVLEHFGHERTLDVLREWVRVLKPGGTLKVAVPDFDRIVHYYQEGLDPKVESYLMGGRQDDNDHHGAIFNGQKLRGLMRLAGLSGIRPWTSEIGDCASLPVSLNLMGTKRAPVERLDGLHAVLSAPRLCFTDQVTAMVECVGKLKLPTRIRQGVFWGQTLTAAIEQAVADGAEYVLTWDYDTVATPDDVVELYRLMRDTPDAAVIFAAQMGRDRNSLLMTIRETADKNRSQIRRDELDAELLPASTGHFGLTLLRVSALKELAKPWFHHQPDKDGGWGDGRVDEDIYFWRQVERAGQKVYQASHVVIGHMQLVATFPDRDLQPIHQYIADYRRDGKPEGVLA